MEGQLDPVTRGDPTGPLRWTCSSAARLAERLRGEGHRVSERTVNRLLHEMGYSLQGNRKTLEGRQHPDRDAQFRHISRRVEAFQRQGQPVVSVDTKKKELIGPYRNGGREWRPKGEPEAVKVHDFVDPEPRRFLMGSTTSEPVGSAWGWITTRPSLRWRVAYPQALLITADGGFQQRRLWKYELLADGGLSIRCVTSRPARANKIGCSVISGELAGQAPGQS